MNDMVLRLGNKKINRNLAYNKNKHENKEKATQNHIRRLKQMHIR